MSVIAVVVKGFLRSLFSKFGIHIVRYTGNKVNGLLLVVPAAHKRVCVIITRRHMKQYRQGDSWTPLPSFSSSTNSTTADQNCGNYTFYDREELQILLTPLSGILGHALLTSPLRRVI